MPYLPSLQESLQPATQGALFSWSGSLMEMGKNNFPSTTSVTLDEDLPSRHSWSEMYGFIEDNRWKIEEGFTTITQTPYLQISSGDVDLRKILLSLFPKEFLQETLFANEEVVVLQQRKFDAILKMQNLLIAWQIWEAGSILMHAFPNVGNWKSWLHLTMPSQEALVVNQSSVVDSSLIDPNSIEQMYVLRGAVDIRRFLEENTYLIQLLKEAYINIREYFPTSDLFLELVVDPEVVDEEQLVIFVAVDQDPDKASEKLNQFDESWWLDAMEKSQDKLCITLEFR